MDIIILSLIQLFEFLVGSILGKFIKSILNKYCNDNKYDDDKKNKLRLNLLNNIIILFIVFLSIISTRYLLQGITTIQVPPIGFSLGFFKYYESTYQYKSLINLI